MSKKETKTNAMRILERMKIPYEMRTYECDEFTDGIHVADLLGISYETMYKTLVTVGKSKHIMFLSFRLPKKLTLKRLQNLLERNRLRCCL